MRVLAQKPAVSPPTVTRQPVTAPEVTHAPSRFAHDFTRIPVHAPENLPVPPIVRDILASPGQPLEGPVRSLMEHHFDTSFGDVRVHCGAAAERSARTVDAQAYTVGRDIVFGAGRFAPATDTGSRLLTHELMHVIEQRSAPVALARQPNDKSSNTLTPADVAHLEAGLHKMMGLLQPTIRLRILRNDTVALGLVRDPDGDLRLVYTVARNRTYPGLEGAANAVGATPWDAEPRAAGRGATGAPGDAEQLMFEAASVNRFRVLGIVVTRAVCPDCAEAAKAERRGGVRVVHVPIPTPRLVSPSGDETVASTPAVGSRPSIPTAPKDSSLRRAATATAGPRRTAPRGGLGIRGQVAVEGAAALIEAIAVPIITHYLQEHYAESNAVEAREEIAKAMEAKRPQFELLVAQTAEIQRVQQEGRKAFLHVIVDTNWADTSIGRVLTKASVARFEIAFEDGPRPKPYSTPEPGGWVGDVVRFGAGVTLDYETFDIELEGTDSEAADRRLSRKLVEKKLQLSGSFEAAIITALEWGHSLEELREYAAYRHEQARTYPGGGPVVQEMRYWTTMMGLIDGPLEDLIIAAKTTGVSLDGCARRR